MPKYQQATNSVKATILFWEEQVGEVFKLIPAQLQKFKQFLNVGSGAICQVASLLEGFLGTATNLLVK